MRASTADQTQPATLLERAGAYVVDSLLTALVWAAIVLALAGGEADPRQWGPATNRLASMLFLVVPFAYFLALEGAWSTTPGKRAFGLRVRRQRDDVGWYGATVRNVLRLAWSLGPLGPVFLALDAVLVQWTERDERLGDRAAGTRVLRTSEAWI